jgi:hypothetical protein
MSEKKNKAEKEENPEKDVLTPIGELSWKNKDKKDEIAADEMFDTPPIAGSAGVEC